jgi:phage gp46-like protein
MSVKVENWADIRELVLMSIGTNKGTWWADESFGSELWLLRRSGKVTGQTAGTLRRMILEATSWLVTDGLVKSIECTAEAGPADKIPYTVTVYRADGESELIKEVWNAVST